MKQLVELHETPAALVQAALEVDRAPRFMDAEKRKQVFLSTDTLSQEQGGRERDAEGVKEDERGGVEGSG